MHPPEIDSFSTALLAGLVTSLHCTGMCGPLACLIMPVKGDRADPALTSTAYHAGRVLSYSFIGILAGSFGHLLVGFLENDIVRWLPWCMVLFFLGMAFRLDRLLPKVKGCSKILFQIQSWSQKRSRVQTALALGLATPLLPCGPLYLVVAGALLSGSAIKGTLFMFTFALGTIPLLWLAQSQFQWFRTKLPPVWTNRLRISLALCSALMLAWRLRGTLGFAGPGLENFICCF